MTPLERDIFKRMEEKHLQWVRDSYALCEMAEIDDSWAVNAVASVLIGRVATIFATLSEPNLRLVTDKLHKQILAKRKALGNDS